VYLTEARARIIPLNKVSSFEEDSGGGIDISVGSTLEPVTDEQLAKWKQKTGFNDESGTKKRGRKPGSKNKNKPLGDMSFVEAKAALKAREQKKGFKKRGRPKGSKNKAR
jgi:hypothetical protein